MKMLIGCELSGTVRKAFRDKGHDAWSCDLLPCDDNSPYHYQCDVRDAVDNNWDAAIFFPDCTYLAGSGLHWNKSIPGRAAKTEAALKFIKFLLDLPIPMIALENPVGCISSRIRKPEQIIQPWQFGHDASKKTCLWLKNLKPLKHTNVIIKDRYANQTPSGQNKLGPSPDRAKIRSKTYQGIADAMADQWG